MIFDRFDPSPKNKHPYISLLAKILDVINRFEPHLIFPLKVDIWLVAIISFSEITLLPLLIFPYIVIISKKQLIRLPPMILLLAVILLIAEIFEALVIFP